MLNKTYTVVFVLCLGFLLLVVYSCVTTMKAETMLSQKKYDRAIPLFEEYLAQKPDSIRARSRLGFAYLKTGRIDDAIAEFESVLEKNPKEPYSILYLGLAYLNKKEYDKAIKMWQKYTDKVHPQIEIELKKQLTLLLIAESQRMAQKALENEEKLALKEPEANSIAVCYYKDFSPDKSLRAFQKGLAAMVITDLSKISALKVVERLRLQALFEEMALGQTGIVDEKTAPRVGKLLGAENVITGNLTPGSVKANTTVKGKVSGTASATVKTEEFFKLPGMIVRDVLGVLGLTMTAKEAAAIGIPHTKVYKAFKAFGEGLDAFDAGNWKKAKNLFDLAVVLDPDFDLARKMGELCPNADAPPREELARRLSSEHFEILIQKWAAEYSKDSGKKEAEIKAEGGSSH